MKPKTILLIGLLLMVLGVVLIILQFREGGKTAVGSIAAGATPIITGSILVGASRAMARKKSSGDPPNAPR